MNTVPRQIDCRSQRLECRGTDSSVKVFPRIPVEAVAQLSVVAFKYAFGDTADITELSYVAGYDNDGKLVVILEKADGQWRSLPLVDGVKQTAYPAVCLVFQDVRAQNSFLSYLKQVKNETMHNPSVALMLSTLKIPPYTTTLDVVDEE